LITSKLLTEIKEAVVGKDYELSFSFVSAAKMRELNRTFRSIDASTDILSFPLSETEGEMYICKSEARKEMLKFDRKFDNFLLFLYIHGLVHLKGFDHSSTMENIEVEFRKKFGV